MSSTGNEEPENNKHRAQHGATIIVIIRLSLFHHHHHHRHRLLQPRFSLAREKRPAQHEISNLRIFSTSVKMRKCREISLRTN